MRLLATVWFVSGRAPLDIDHVEKWWVDGDVLNVKTYGNSYYVFSLRNVECFRCDPQ